MFDPRLCLKIFTDPKFLELGPFPSPELKTVVLDPKPIKTVPLLSFTFFDNFIIFKVRGGFEPVHFSILVIEHRLLG